jgi:DNA-directed RNA polymerase subunit RPC12/RpoP
MRAQRSIDYYVDKDFYPTFVGGFLDAKIQYPEFGMENDEESCWFLLIGGDFEEGLQTLSAMLLFEYGIEHYLDDYEKTTLCVKCGADLEAEYGDKVIVWRYWKFCPYCGTELVQGYVKVRGNEND